MSLIKDYIDKMMSEGVDILEVSNPEPDTYTGSPEGQIATFSYRIANLTGHLKKNRKDFSTQRSLINLVSKRRKLLNYLKDIDIERYRMVIKELNLRK